MRLKYETVICISGKENQGDVTVQKEGAVLETCLGRKKASLRSTFLDMSEWEGASQRKIIPE